TVAELGSTADRVPKNAGEQEQQNRHHAMAGCPLAMLVASMPGVLVFLYHGDPFYFPIRLPKSPRLRKSYYGSLTYRNCGGADNRDPYFSRRVIKGFQDNGAVLRQVALILRHRDRHAIADSLQGGPF